MARYDAAYYRRRSQQLRRRQQWLRIRRRLLRRRAGRTSPAEVVVVVVIGLALHFGHDVTGASAAAKPSVQDAAAAGQPGPAAVKAIAYAEHQLGCSYQWGGTGPCSSGYDCSGLIWAAYRSAGVTIPRTSQTQWAGLPHIPASQVRPGDLVFFPGSDGSWSAPGHVALVLSKTRMLQAYATGTPIEISPLNGDGAGGIVGYARP